MSQTTRDIKRVFVHCTGTRPSATVASIRRSFAARGWTAPGYHYLIDQYGAIHTLLSEEQVANGVAGYNRTSIHVAYIGGIDSHGHPADTRTPQQRHSLRCAVKVLLADYPGAKALGHRDISPDRNGNGVIDPWERVKACPCFDVATEL